MDKFTETFLRELHGWKGLLYFDLEKWNKALDEAVVFTSNTINEDKNLLIDVPDLLIEFCLSHQEQLVKLSQINNIFKNSKHYTNIGNNLTGKNFYFAIFDFNDDNLIENFLLKVSKTINQILIVRKKIEEYSYADGILFLYAHTYFCCINSNAKNRLIETIHHLLSHFMQDICHIRKTPGSEFDKKVDNSILNDLNKLLNIDLNTLIYFFNKKEYSVFIDEICKSLLLLHSTFYSHLSKYIFLNKEVFDVIKNTSLDKIKYSDLFIKFNMINKGNMQPIVMLVAAYHLNYKYISLQNIILRYFYKGE